MTNKFIGKVNDATSPPAMRAPPDALGLEITGSGEELRAQLPKSLQEIGREMSMQGMVALIKEFGGVRVFIPKVPNSSSRLASALSAEDFKALCAARGGEYTSIARGARLWAWIRAQKVLALHAAGGRIGAIASQLEITERHVLQITGRHRRALQQRPTGTSRKTTAREKRIKR